VVKKAKIKQTAGKPERTTTTKIVKVVTPP